VLALLLVPVSLQGPLTQLHGVLTPAEGGEETEAEPVVSFIQTLEDQYVGHVQEHTYIHALHVIEEGPLLLFEAVDDRSKRHQQEHILRGGKLSLALLPAGLKLLDALDQFEVVFELGVHLFNVELLLTQEESDVLEGLLYLV